MSELPAGWYPDGGGATRWWDGAAWTEHVQPEPGAEETAEEPGGGRAWKAVTLGLVAVALVAALVIAGLLIRKPPKIAANCDSLATIVTGLNEPPLTQPRLKQLTGLTVVQDNSTTYKKPTGVEPPTLIYSCRGLGSYLDGTQSPTLVELTYSADGSFLVTYAAA